MRPAIHGTYPYRLFRKLKRPRFSESPGSRVGVLGRLARLDVQQLDTMLLSPLLQRSADELRAVVQAQALGCTAQFHQLVQRPDYPQGRQAGVDLDPQRLAVEIVVDVEGAEAPSGPQSIGHEVRRPGVVGLVGNRQRFPDAGSRRLPRRGRLSLMAT